MRLPQHIVKKVLRPKVLELALLGAALTCAAGAAGMGVLPEASQASSSTVATVLSEDFESWPPSGWVLTADPQTGGVWKSLAHPAGCAAGSSFPYSNATGGAGLCADANSDCLGDGMDTTMVTPSFSLASPAYLSAQLQFKSDFFCAAALDEGWVDITTDGGAVWTNLLYFDHQSVRGQDTETLDLTPYLGPPDVRLSFEYAAPGWDWFWQVDDVLVTAVQQEPCTITCTATVPASAVSGNAVSFAAAATPTAGCTGTPSFAWSFGDGQSSIEQNPLHTYAAAGSYDWSLAATTGGASCSKSGTLVVTSSCSLSCTASVPTSAFPGIAVPFAATATPSAGCTGTPSFSWSFGDGQSSTEQNPSHTYASPGTFNWTLVATQNGAACTKTGTLTVTAPPVVSLMKKAAPPFRIVVVGSNLQRGIRVFIGGAEWTSVVWKNTTKVVLKGALKSAIPKGVAKTFRFVNPDGGETTMTWSW